MSEETTVLPATHPDADTLAAFGRGELPPAELAAVAVHVARCDACCAVVAAARDDTLVGLAREVGATPPDSTPAPAGHTAVTPDRPPDLPSIAGVPAALVDHPRYRILGELGAGGMGVVYKAEHRMMDRVVALKVMAPHLTARREAVERFRKEVKAAAKLDHPNIVRAHDAEEAGGLHFLVMEYVEGISLDRLVTRRGPLPVPMACQFARQVALGLQHAAGRGMVHRDIKPHNLMVTRKGQVKVLDFGLARFARDVEAEGVPGTRKAAATAPNLVMGTPDYISPEQAQSSRDVDIRADLYSLGCTLHYLLTGQVPFPAATSLIDKLLAHTQDQPAPVASLRPEVPDALAVALARMMAKKSADRFQTPAEVAAALAPFAKGTDGSPSPANATAVPPAFEVVDAIAVAPPTPYRATPTSGAGDFEFDTNTDTEPEAKSPTVPAEAGEPREKRTGRRKKPAPSFWARHKKLLTVAGVVLGGLLVGAAVKQMVKGRGSPDPNAGNGLMEGKPSTPGPAVPPTGEKPPTVLFVLPNYGLWLRDYAPVREKLERGGARVTTAAGRRTPAVPHPDSGDRSQAVPIDLALTPDLDVSGYAAVVFVGRNPGEYAGPGPGGVAARAVIEKMRRQNRVVAAICEGRGVLAKNGVLSGKAVASRPAAQDLIRGHPEFQTGDIHWQEKGVVTDGKLVTAAYPDDAEEFATALLKALKE
jgi:serine/threonine-protein kinase